MKNRIQIVNWRKHGDDESYCYVGVYSAQEQTTAQQEIEQQVDEDYDWEQDEDPETRADWDHVIYYNDELTFEDGQILAQHNGRKFRVRIEELTE